MPDDHLIAGSPFLAYLRGIETFRQWRVELKTPQFLAYLRGIETRHIPRAPVSSPGFLAYLRGIETTNRTLHKIDVYLIFSLPTRN